MGQGPRFVARSSKTFGHFESISKNWILILNIRTVFPDIFADENIFAEFAGEVYPRKYYP